MKFPTTDMLNLDTAKVVPKYSKLPNFQSKIRSVFCSNRDCKNDASKQGPTHNKDNPVVQQNTTQYISTFIQ